MKSIKELLEEIEQEVVKKEGLTVDELIAESETVSKGGKG